MPGGGTKMLHATQTGKNKQSETPPTPLTNQNQTTKQQGMLTRKEIQRLFERNI